MIARAARDNDGWPSLLLLLAVLVPAACLLWFMAAAMRNERSAARERLADACRVQLAALQTMIERQWGDTVANLEQIVKSNSPSEAFAHAVRTGLVDSLVIFGEKGELLYPDSPVVMLHDGPSEAAWAEANYLEFSRKDFNAAAQRYRALATQLTNVNLSARALQAAARCLVQSGEQTAAVELIKNSLGHENYRHATDAQGRLIVANAELMGLELITDKTSSVFETIAGRLEQRLDDYDNVLASPQRRFLMAQVEQLTSGATRFPTLRAERLAADFASRADRSFEPFLQPSPVPNVWQIAAANGQVVGLFKTETLMKLHAVSQTFAANGRIELLPPGAVRADAFVALPAGTALRGWTLVLSLDDSKPFDTVAKHRTALYLWTALAVVVAMTSLSVLALRSVRRRVALARLKNDLVATVSHELKTPLASMRVLIDTLLDSDRLNEQTTREYLQLIATENERLSRLIHNFLTFARLEQRKRTFNLSSLPASRIVDAVVNAVRERFSAPGCRFEVQTEADLPNVLADPDALTIALVNLLDNAWKYSGDIKHIALRATSENGHVILAVQDNGTGISALETKRIFESFYQVDQRLSRSAGGCGLGLSIVQSIVTAHGGRVSVSSEPGRGSTFTITLPIGEASAVIEKEAIA